MDDLQEKETADLKHIASYVYASCWTDDAEESIPMWRMYTPNNAGVRIAMPASPFKMYRNDAESIAEKTGMTVSSSADSTPPMSMRPYYAIFTEGVLAPALQTDDQSSILFKMNYTDDEDLLYPKVYSEDGGQAHIALELLGKHKNTYWSFQKEWRFIFVGMRFDILRNMTNPVLAFSLAVQEMVNGKARQPFPYYDLSIDEAAFSNMEITMSPQLSAGNRIIVESLVEKYNPTARLRNSDLQGLI